MSNIRYHRFRLVMTFVVLVLMIFGSVFLYWPFHHLTSFPKEDVYNLKRSMLIDSEVIVISEPKSSNVTILRTAIKVDNKQETDFIRLAVASCGPKRHLETIALIKSVIISGMRFHLENLEFFVFTDKKMFHKFSRELTQLKEEIAESKSNLNFRFEIKLGKFPPENRNTWRQLYQPCASQRLFLSTALSHVREILYLDADTLIIGDLRKIWSMFAKMNPTQHSGLVIENESTQLSYYTHFSKTPYHFPSGLNSGVFLMNLTRFREFHWEKKVKQYYNEYRKDLLLGDQDIINIIFHFYPEYVYLMPCNFNYRIHHCLDADKRRICFSAESERVQIVHGNEEAFITHHPVFTFKILFDHFLQFDITNDEFKDLQDRIVNDLKQPILGGDSCKSAANLFISAFQS